jgi:hypothetical protein
MMFGVESKWMMILWPEAPLELRAELIQRAGQGCTGDNREFGGLQAGNRRQRHRQAQYGCGERDEQRLVHGCMLGAVNRRS